MRHGALYDRSGNATRVAHVARTSNAFERLRGLLGRPAPAPDHGLLIDPCASVHMLFMRYAIDVVYLDRDFVVTRVVAGLRPWRLSAAPGSAMTLELRAGEADRLGLAPGVALRWDEIA